MNSALLDGEEKEQLLREDRRLLGRLLGEVIEEQVGKETRKESKPSGRRRCASGAPSPIPRWQPKRPR